MALYIDDHMSPVSVWRRQGVQARLGVSLSGLTAPKNPCLLTCKFALDDGGVR
jgi:hypothetical protein